MYNLQILNKNRWTISNINLIVLLCSACFFFYLSNDVSFQSHIIARKDMSKMLCPCLHTSNDFVEWNCTLKLTIRSQSKELGRSSSRSIYLLKHIGHLRYERRSHGLTTGNGKAQDRPTKLFEPRYCFKTHQLESILKNIVVIRGKWKFEEEGDDDVKEQVQNILKPALSVGIGDRWLRRRHLNKKLYGPMGLPQNKN